MISWINYNWLSLHIILTQTSQAILYLIAMYESPYRTLRWSKTWNILPFWSWLFPLFSSSVFLCALDFWLLGPPMPLLLCGQHLVMPAKCQSWPLPCLLSLPSPRPPTTLWCICSSSPTSRSSFLKTSHSSRQCVQSAVAAGPGSSPSDPSTHQMAGLPWDSLLLSLTTVDPVGIVLILLNASAIIPGAIGSPRNLTQLPRLILSQFWEMEELAGQVLSELCKSWCSWPRKRLE